MGQTVNDVLKEGVIENLEKTIVALAMAEGEGGIFSGEIHSCAEAIRLLQRS